MSSIKTYSDLSKIYSFNERFEYLKLSGSVGQATFGFDRFINQAFYKSREWKTARDFVIVRDNGCDLGVDGYEIHDLVLVHHMNPITVDNIVNEAEMVFNPEYLITVSHKTHNGLHYGKMREPELFKERFKNDTKLW